MHIHVDPDVVGRIVTDVALARRFLELGMAGFQLKSHYTSTAERARVVNEAVPGIHCVGALTLNRAVGGLNPIAVEIAAREGARTVWLPTVNSVNEQEEVHEPVPGARTPVWVRLELELREAGVPATPVAVLDEHGVVLDELRAVFAVMARHGMVLATGHLGRDEIFAIVPAAFEAGIETVVVTHPEFPSQNLSIDDQVALADQGAFMERCFTTPYTGKAPWERFFESSRAVGAERTVWSTDLGQVFNPPVEDGLALMAEQFFAAGFDEQVVHTMAVENTRMLAGRSGDA
jgi:hypothetical protein